MVFDYLRRHLGVYLGRKINSFRPTKAYPQLERFVEVFKVCSPVDFLYLGDSVVERVANEDEDRRTLGQMFKDASHNNTIVLSGSAYNIEIYFLFLKVAVEKLLFTPKLVIFPINLRSFSPQWYLAPKWQLHQEIRALNTFLSSSSMRIPMIQERLEVTPSELKQFHEVSVGYPFTDFIQVGEFAQIIASSPQNEQEIEYRRKQIFIFHYLHPLSPEHPRLQQLRGLLAYLEQKDIRFLCYVTPINYQAAEQLIGIAFSSIVSNQIETVSGVVQPYLLRNRGSFINFAFSMSSDLFFHVNESTEHLNEHGRRLLANWLVEQILHGVS